MLDETRKRHEGSECCEQDRRDNSPNGNLQGPRVVSGGRRSRIWTLCVAASLPSRPGKLSRRARLSKSLCGGVEDGDGNAIQRRASELSVPDGSASEARNDARYRESARWIDRGAGAIDRADAPGVAVRHYSLRTERSYLQWAERFFWLITAASWRSTTTRE